jgi:hypothetical protein
MCSQDQVQGLKAPFPAEALSADTSRGFELTSIKAAYVIERLNEVFGLCGTGWRYVHSPFEEEKGVEVVTEVALQYRCQEGGTHPITWDGSGWAYRTDATQDWSEPIFACGGHAVGRGAVPYTDARKSAVTDGLTKAASMLGIGHEVFKGLVRVGVKIEPRNMPKGGNGKEPTSTAFWELYHQEAKAAGIPMKIAKGLAQQGDWATACKDLRTLIAAA